MGAKKVKRCTIVSGAPNDCSEFIKEHIDRSSFIIAADDGYTHLLQAGIMPDLIIADFDSSEKPDLLCEIISFPEEKDYTDTFNCVRYAVAHGFTEIIIFNALGSRFDHSFGNVLCLSYCKKHGVFCQLTDAYNRLTLVDKEYTFRKDYDCFSLFAFLEDCEGVRINGAHYSAGWYGVDALSMPRDDQSALCNYVEEDTCSITVEHGTLLLVESND